MTEHILCVGGVRELPGVLRGLAADVRISVLAQHAVTSSLREPESFLRVTGLDADDDPALWTDAALALDEADPVTRVAAFGERDQHRAAAVAQALGLPMHSPQTVAWVHHKPAMRARLAECGVDDTPAAVVRDADELREFVREHGYPCIAKPAVGAGSFGVRRILGPGDVAEAFRAAAEPTAWTSGGVLVEVLHQGPQFSVEAFSEAGRHQVVCVTRKYSEPRCYVELGHVAPAGLAPADQEAVAAYVGEVLTALGIAFGPTHTELVLTADGPRIIETHIRLAGDDIPYLVRDALGVDLVRYTARQSLGERGLLDELRAELALAAAAAPRHAAVWYAVTQAAALLESVSGEDRVRALEHVDEVKVFFGPGDVLEPLASSDSRLALVRTHAPTPALALELARDAVAALEFRSLLHTRVGCEPV